MGRSIQFIRATVFLSFFFIIFNFHQAQAKCVYLEPVQIMEMEVGNLLTWTTAEEEDVQFFVIQKSFNGKDFKKVGDIKGAGFSKSENKYRFLDFSSNEDEEKSYYRLLLVESNGNFTVSETFHIGQPSGYSWTIISNSARVQQSLELEVQSGVVSPIYYEIKNSNGKSLKRGKSRITKGVNELSVNCKSLKAGEYQVTLWTKKDRETISIIKM